MNENELLKMLGIGKMRDATADELKSVSDYIKSISRLKIGNSFWDELDSPCHHCTNNPRNGGSGICHCILGIPKIY